MPARPSFDLCGKFSGNSEDSAERWLSKFDYEMEDFQNDDGTYPPKKYLNYLNMLLIEDAVKWAERDPDARRLLTEAKTNPTQTTVEDFRALFCESFPSQEIEISPISFEVELAELHQRPEEPLSSYYKRVCALLKEVGARDRPASTSTLPALTKMESTFLDTVLRAFNRGLNDPELRKEATRAMAHPDRSLLGLYTLAEETRRTSLEVRKLLDEEAKTDELQFYKSLVEKNLPQHQVASLLASYHAAKEPRGKPQHSQYRWTYHTDPPQPMPEAPQQASAQSQEYRQQAPASQLPHTGMNQAPPPHILTQNQNRGNAGRNANPSTGSRFKSQQPTPKEMPDRTVSKNPWINGTLSWSYGKDGLLCVRCGTKGHSARNCDGSPLPAWEQSYLRMIVFGDNPQVNFASVGFGEYDGATKPYGTEIPKSSAASTISSTSSGQVTPSTSSIDSYITPRASSVQFGVAGLATLPQTHSADAKTSQASPEAFLGEIRPK